MPTLRPIVTGRRPAQLSLESVGADRGAVAGDDQLITSSSGASGRRMLA